MSEVIKGIEFKDGIKQIQNALPVSWQDPVYTLLSQIFHHYASVQIDPA